MGVKGISFDSIWFVDCGVSLLFSVYKLPIVEFFCEGDFLNIEGGFCYC